MKRSEAAKYARWSAAVALCLAGITAAVYLGRGVQRIRDRRAAPPPAPAYVDRQLSGISFSKVEGNTTIYTVEASHSTDFKGEAASLLEDVKITVFGKEQNRNDILHTRTCRYTKRQENIDCSGLVQMDLMSADDAKLLKERPELEAARVVHVETQGVVFERNTGIAKTAEPITFRLPNGTGEARGVEYRSNEGLLQLEHDVRFRLTAPPSKAAIVDTAMSRVIASDDSAADDSTSTASGWRIRPNPTSAARRRSSSSARTASSSARRAVSPPR
jgi:lipopolysaccharide export system protein LptC